MKVTEKSLPKLQPDQINDDVCKAIYALLYHPDTQGARYDRDKEPQLLSTMMPESAKIYRDWRIAYDADQKKVSMFTKQKEVPERENVLPLLDFENGRLRKTVKNWCTILENDVRFAGKIRFNTFDHAVFLHGSVPWENEKNLRAWTDRDDSALFMIIQSEYGLSNKAHMYDAVQIIANKNSFHPVKEYLLSLQWDGREHIYNLLHDFLGADDSEYNAEVMRLFMLGAVARVFNPGIKFDYCPIIQGGQGIGKSTFVQCLALNDAWYSDSISNMESDKAYQGLLGTWIIELGELKAMTGNFKSIENVKAFITARQDKIRLPYDRRSQLFDRQCVFIGTTNQTTFLVDETGNRRFLIIDAGRCEKTRNIFDASCMDEIKQAWAQAVQIWQTEKPKLVLSEKMMQIATSMQESAMVDDGMQGMIAEYLRDKTETCARLVWNECLQESGPPKRNDTMRINNIISKMPEWERVETPMRFAGIGNQRGYKKKLEYTFQTVDDNEKLPFE